MKESQVPQDQSQTYGGNKKLMYAVGDSGEYTSVTSSGWTVEEEANRAAVEECERLAAEAWHAIKNGQKSPLAYHIYKQRMDLPMIAQVTGLFQWRVKRHLKPAVFSGLSSGILERYSDALGVPVDDLKQIPKQP